MANRTNPNAVIGVLPHLETGFNPATFIDQAHRMIERLLVVPGEETDPEVLTDLELYLAAHLVTVANPVASSEGGTGVNTSYARGQLTKGLDSTPAGQICRSLDRTGILTNTMLGKQPFILEAFGT